MGLRVPPDPGTKHSDLWAECYRPCDRDNIPLFTKRQVDTIFGLVDRAFKYRSRENRILVISGPNGSGKTTIIHTVCNELRIQILEFIPDEAFEWNPNDGESFYVAAVRSFIGKGQFVVAPQTKRLLLFDHVDIPQEERRALFKFLNEFANDPRNMFPVVWVINDDNYLDFPHQTFKVPPASITLLKRILKRVAGLEGIPLDKETMNDILVDNPGDIALALNNFQFARTFSPGGYQALSYFQAIGHILRSKRERNVFDIMEASPASPSKLLAEVYLNFHDYFSVIEEVADGLDYVSMADTLFSEKFIDPQLEETGAYVGLAGIVECNNHPISHGFKPVREGRKSVLRMRDCPGRFCCWPKLHLSPETMDELLFPRDALVDVVSTPQSDRSLPSHEELDEERRVLEEDPIEESE